jgi:hypothetical protein
MTLPLPLEVTVTDVAGAGVAGHAVSFTASAGTLNPPNATTDAQGRARSLLTLPSAVAPVSVTATAEGLTPVTFTAQVVPPPVEITTSFLPAARRSLPYASSLAAAGGASNGSFSFSVSSGNLPAGLTLDGSAITGTPQESGAFSVGIRASDGLESDVTKTFTINVCDVPSPMAVGEVRSFGPSNRGSCGIFLPSGSAGERYRVTVLRTENHQNGDDIATIRFHLAGNGVTASASDASASSAVRQHRRPLDIPHFDRHVRRLEQNRPEHLRQLAESEALARHLGPGAILPSESAAPLAAAAMALPEKLRLDASTPAMCGGQTETNPVTAIRLAEGDWLALYQDSAQNASASTRVTAEEAARLLEITTAYGKPVIDAYFGGVQDTDANGKVIVFVTPAVDEQALGRVWSGDFYPKARCAPSNAGEYIYLHRDAVRSIVTAEGQHPGPMTLIHELKHVSSLYQRILRAGGGSVNADRPVDFNPVWMEEGGAELAAELSGRYAWAALGGPPMNVPVTEEHFRVAGGGTNVRIENFAVLYMLFGTQEALSHQPNSVVARTPGGPSSSVYSSGWVFQRWLGDAYGSASSAPMADAPFFRQLNGRATASGIPGIEAMTGRSWSELMEEFSTAAMANGQGVDVARAFTSYDFVSAIEMWCFAVDPVDLEASGCSGSAGAPGAFPWPVTTDSEGRSESRGFLDGLVQGGAGPSGFRVHDLVSNGTGHGTEINVETGVPARVLVVRIR